MKNIRKTWQYVFLAGVVAGSLFFAAVSRSAQAAKPTPTAEVVRARRFEVVDAKGKVRMALYTTPGKDVVGLDLRDAKGSPKIVMSVTGDGKVVAVALWDKNATFSVIDPVSKERGHYGLNMLSFSTGKGQYPAALGYAKGVGGTLRLANPTGTKTKTIGP